MLALCPPTMRCQLWRGVFSTTRLSDDLFSAIAYLTTAAEGIPLPSARGIRFQGLNAMPWGRTWLSRRAVMTCRDETRHSHCSPSKHSPTLVYSWANVVDGGPTVNQRWANVPCLSGKYVNPALIGCIWSYLWLTFLIVTPIITTKKLINQTCRWLKNEVIATTRLRVSILAFVMWRGNWSIEVPLCIFIYLSVLKGL